METPQFFLPFSELDQKHFVGKILAGLLKLHSEVRFHNFCGKQFVCERSILVLAVSDIEWISFGPLSKTFWLDWDNCLQCVHMNIFTKNINFLQKVFFYSHFGTVSDDFWHFVEKIFDDVVKTASYLFIGSSWWEKYFDEKTLMFFNQFETFSEKVLAVCRELFVGLLQFQSTCSKIFILRKKICSKVSFFHHLGQQSKKYRTSSNIFRRCCQNWILRVHKNVLSFKNCILSFDAIVFAKNILFVKEVFLF